MTKRAICRTCLASRAATKTSDIAQFVSPPAIEGNDIHLWLDDALSPLAMEGSAISVEVVQSVTVAALGQDIADGATDITGAAPSIVMATAPAVTPQRSVVNLDPEQ